MCKQASGYKERKLYRPVIRVEYGEHSRRLILPHVEMKTTTQMATEMTISDRDTSSPWSFSRRRQTHGVANMGCLLVRTEAITCIRIRTKYLVAQPHVLGRRIMTHDKLSMVALVGA